MVQLEERVKVPVFDEAAQSQLDIGMHVPALTPNDSKKVPDGQTGNIVDGHFTPNLLFPLSTAAHVPVNGVSVQSEAEEEQSFQLDVPEKI